MGNYKPSQSSGSSQSFETTGVIGTIICIWQQKLQKEFSIAFYWFTCFHVFFEIAQVYLRSARCRVYRGLLQNEWVIKTFRKHPKCTKFVCIKLLRVDIVTSLSGDIYSDRTKNNIKMKFSLCVIHVLQKFYNTCMEYLMESAGVLYLHTICWRIQKQRVRKYRTKHIPCGTVFIIYILSFKFLFIIFNANQDKTLLHHFNLKTHGRIIT